MALRENRKLPPFELPTAKDLVESFTTSRFRHYDEQTRELMKDSCKMFIKIINMYELDTDIGDEWGAYGNITLGRWRTFCDPARRNFPNYVKPIDAFGRMWLRMVFPRLRKFLKRRRRIEVVGDRPIILLRSFYRFLREFEKDVFSSEMSILGRILRQKQLEAREREEREKNNAPDTPEDPKPGTSSTGGGGGEEDIEKEQKRFKLATFLAALSYCAIVSICMAIAL